MFTRYRLYAFVQQLLITAIKIIIIITAIVAKYTRKHSAFYRTGERFIWVTKNVLVAFSLLLYCLIDPQKTLVQIRILKCFLSISIIFFYNSSRPFFILNCHFFFFANHFEIHRIFCTSFKQVYLNNIVRIILVKT